MGDSPAVILYDPNGVELAVQDGVALPVGTRGLLGAGIDAANVVRFLRVLSDGSLSVAQPLSSSVVVADYQSASVGATSYFMGVDLSNSSGAYKHSSGSAIKLVGVSSSATKVYAVDDWNVRIGTVLSISGSSSVIGWLRFGALLLRNTLMLEVSTVDKDFPVPVDLGVSGGDYLKIAAGNKETVAAVNTGATLPDVSGVAVTPDVGDLIVRAERVTGTGVLTMACSFWYLVE